MGARTIATFLGGGHDRRLVRRLEAGGADDERLAAPRRLGGMNGGRRRRGEIDDHVRRGEESRKVVARRNPQRAQSRKLAKIAAYDRIALGLDPAGDLAALAAGDLGDEHPPHAPAAAGDPDRDLRHRRLSCRHSPLTGGGSGYESLARS